MAFLDGLAAQDDAPPFEVLVGLDGDPSLARVVHDRFPHARVGRVSGVNLGAARNFLVKIASGEVLLFFDDDVELHPLTLRGLAEIASSHPEAAVLGGPNETPPRSSRFQRVQGAVLASLIGTGPVRRRYGAHRPGPADERYFTLCNLAIRRRDMKPFAPELVGGEENAVLDEMSRAGLAMYYDPRLWAYHQRRSTPRAFMRQMIKYGFGRGQLTRRVPRTLRPAYLAPALLVGYVATLPALAILSRLALLPLALYAALVVAGAAAAAVRLRSATAAPLAAALIVTVHVGYGFGVILGLLRRPRRAGEARWVQHRAPFREGGADTILEEAGQ